MKAGLYFTQLRTCLLQYSDLLASIQRCCFVATVPLVLAEYFRSEANFRSLGDLVRPASAQILMLPKRHSQVSFGQALPQN
jgi:hypothetical protein